MNAALHPIETGEHRPALVLNADFRPLSYYPLSLWSWQDTIKAVCQDKVVIVEEYDEQIASPSVSMTLPSVIALKDYVVRTSKPAFTRFNLFLGINLPASTAKPTFPPKTSPLTTLFPAPKAAALAGITS